MYMSSSHLEKLLTRTIAGIFSLAALAHACTGCAALAVPPQALQAQAAPVQLVTNVPVQDYIYVGEAIGIGNQGNQQAAWLVQEEVLERNALNDLKNKAFAMGGHLVQLLNVRSTPLHPDNASTVNAGVANVVYVGAVYRQRSR
jgi:hypothetical protein